MSAAVGPWTAHGLPRAIWCAVADHVAERSALPAVADVIAATGCGEGDAARAVVAYARYHGLVGEGVGASPCCRSFLARAGGPHEAGCPAAKPKAATPGSLYLDRDGELVQVLTPSAWDHERWGPTEPGLTVCRVLASAPRYEATGEVVQRDLRGAVLLRDAAGRVPAALLALANAG